jgi:hypothetical protein
MRGASKSRCETCDSSVYLSPEVAAHNPLRIVCMRCFVANPPDKVFVLIPQDQIENVRRALASRYN